MAMQIHPAAAIFPLLEGPDLDALVESIRSHGLREPIKLYQGKVIDGRNRMAACRIAQVEPRFEKAEVNGSAADYVYDLNYHRRHLSDGGKQLAAGRYKEIAAEEAKERQRAAGKEHGRGQVVAKTPQAIPAPKSRDVAGQKFGVSGKIVDAAEKVLKKAAPEVVKAVERGDVKVSTAARLADAPKKVQRAAVAGGKKAVRQAIEKHAPSPSEEARNDAGVRWHKAMHDIRVRLVSTREAGGIKELCRQWTPEQREQYAQDLEEFRKEFDRWIKVLRSKDETPLNCEPLGDAR